MNYKYWFAIITTIFLVSMASSAFSAITVTDMNVSCDPVTPSNGTCYNGSNITLTFKVIDSNVLPPSGDVTSLADGNTANWRLNIYRGSNGDYSKGFNGIAIVTDANIWSYCTNPNIAGWTDNNFNKGHNCSIRMTPIQTIKNGTNGFDVNVATYQGATYVRENADKNNTVTFPVNNALATNQTISLLNILPILLAGIAMILGLMLALSGYDMTGLVVFIAGVMMIILFSILMYTGFMTIFTG
jgi:hypothetical protein